MAPHTNDQLVLSEVVADTSLPAMRVKLYGLRRGSADLLVLGTKTYALEAEGSTITTCRDLGDTGWRPLPREWLTRRSRCAGSGPLGDTMVDWWKTPIDPAPASYWIWHKTSDGTPFRLVFPSASDRLAPFSRYAMSYQVAFEPQATTDFVEVAKVCKSRSGKKLSRSNRL
jgi:hypothetical protein